MVEKNLAGRHIFVTGGAQGIGEAIVRDCAVRGATVSFVDLNEQSGAECAKRLQDDGLLVSFAQCDITDARALERVMADMESKLGGFAGVVNNAGRNSSADAVEMTEDEWDDFFDLDLKASWLTCKFALPSMRTAGAGSIVNIASVHAHMSYPNYCHYAAAKSGLLGLTRNLALNEGPRGIRVNTVSPGYTMTPLLQAWFESVPGSKERALEVHPLGKFGQPTDVAAAVSFLLSDDAGNISGADLRVDGALTARFAG